jgi:hypothetical protein
LLPRLIVLATPDEPIAKVPPLPAEMATADAPVPPWIATVLAVAVELPIVIAFVPPAVELVPIFIV